MNTRGEGFGIKFLKAHLHDEDGPCVIWPLFRDPDTGYGKLGHEGQQLYAHRLMCKLANGEAPSKKHQATHSCGRGHEGCIHPKHLSWKTNQQNQLDRAAHGTMRKRGHVRFVLTHEIAAEIRRIGDKETKTAIAKRYGTSRDTVAKILDGRAWNPARWKHKFRGFQADGGYTPLRKDAPYRDRNKVSLPPATESKP